MIRSKICDEKERKALLLGGGARLCFLGIGGVGMHALAAICAFRGVSVFGADMKENAYTRALSEMGIRVFFPEAGAAVEDATAVVCSLAIREDHPDVLRARSLGIPIFTRGALLGALMAESTTSIAVSGSHGKSTVTAALASVLEASEKNPTVVSGASLAQKRESYHIGGNEIFLAEACEYGDSFLSLRPSLSLFLNLEWDHPDYFPSEEALMRSFARAAMQSGVVLYSAESPLLQKTIDRYGIKNALSVGQNEDCDFRYELVSYENARATIRFFSGKEEPLLLPLSVEGRFQAQNAAMVLAAASYLSLPKSFVLSSLSSFCGISRRLSCIRRDALHPIYYDYAHHPTEIRAGIETLKDLHPGKVTVVFRPHTFSRTEALFADFSTALKMADRVIVTDIDGARESGNADLARSLSASAGGLYVPLSCLEDVVTKEKDGPLVFMGAGDFSSVLAALALGDAENKKDS